MASKKKAQAEKVESPVVKKAAAHPIMEATVNEKTRHGTVIAFSGHEYVRYEWRRVPAGFEEQAERHPHLNTRVRNVAEEETQEEAEALVAGAVTGETETSEQDQSGDSQDSDSAADDQGE